MAVTITFGIQKGGCGKTTTSGIMAHLLANEYNKKVLIVDLDSQGNQTEFLTQVEDIYDFQGRTIFEALKNGDASDCILGITENLHLIPANDDLATFQYWLYHEGATVYSEDGNNHLKALRKVLEPLQDHYDYIFIDTPPALGELTLNALTASDHVVIMFESSKFCKSAVRRFIESVEFVQGTLTETAQVASLNPTLKIAGILRNLMDVRRSDMKALIEIMEEIYPSLCFETVINRQAATGRISISGWGSDNVELRRATEPYHNVLKELFERVGQTK